MTFNLGHFKREFPDYPADAMPALPDAGMFTDTSWHNDACPSFTSDLLGLLVWVDYPDVSMREHANGCRFILEKQEAGIETGKTVCESDDWADIERAIAEAAAPKVTAPKLVVIRSIADPTRKARALAHIIVKLWATWSDQNEDIADDGLRLTLEQVRALDLRQVDGTLSAPLNVFARAYLDQDNPEDLTFGQMIESIEICIGLDAS